MNCSGPDLLSPRHRLEDRIGNSCTYFLKGTFIYKDGVYIDLSHRGCPPLLVTC